MTPHDRLDAAMIERGVGATVRSRVLRLNPVLREGYQLYGFAGRTHLRTVRASRFLRDVCTRAEFERAWGLGSYRKLMDREFVSGGGRRRWVTRQTLEAGPQG